MPPFPVISTATVECIQVQAPGTWNVSTAAWPAANTAYFMPFTVEQPFTVTQIFTYTQTSSGNIDMGIYAEDGTRLTSTGSTAASGTNTVQAVDITDITLTPGRYYLAMAVDNTTHSAYRWSNNFGLEFQRATGCFQMASAFPLPATATFATLTSAYSPGVAITSRSFV